MAAETPPDTTRGPMELSPESHVALTDLMLSEVQHFLVSIHEQANGPIFLDSLHDLEWTTLSCAGEAGELANKVKKIRRDGIDVLSHNQAANEQLHDLRCEAADVAVYLVVAATLLGMSLSDLLQLACESSRTWAEDRGLDLSDIATRGGVLFKYVIPHRVAALSPEDQERYMHAREDEAPDTETPSV